MLANWWLVQSYVHKPFLIRRLCWSSTHDKAKQVLKYGLLSDLRQVHSNESTNSIAANGLLIFDGALTSEIQTVEVLIG